MKNPEYSSRQAPLQTKNSTLEKPMTAKAKLWIFGEVLFDTFPDGTAVLGGAPLNVAWNLRAFGENPQLISAVGKDAPGRILMERMDRWQMSRKHLGELAEYPTGKVSVHLVHGEPSYTLEEDQAYDYIPAAVLPPQSTGWLYFGSLALRTAHNQAILHTLRQRHQGKLFADINLRPPFWTREGILALVEGLDWLKLNEKELGLITNRAGQDVEAQARHLKVQCGLEGLVVTCGSQGAFALGSDSVLHWVKPQKALQAVDTVGAGDAFASVVLLGLQHSWPLPRILERAQHFASAVVGIQGAISEDIALYHNNSQGWNHV
jgi:fructokinase